MTSIDFKALNIPSSTRDYLERRGFLEPSEIVNYGRKLDLNFKIHPNKALKASKWRHKLISSLDQAGFIRHELYPTTYCVWRFYKSLFQDEVDDLYSNAVYENTAVVTDHQFSNIMEILDSLSEKEKQGIIVYFGLDGSGPKSLKMTEKILGISSESIRHLNKRTMRKLRVINRKSKFPKLFGFIPPEYKPDQSQTKMTIDPPDLSLGIEAIELSVRVYNNLRRHHINTIYDIINLPNENWNMIDGFGPKSSNEVVKGIRALGYLDFDIELLS